MDFCTLNRSTVLSVQIVTYMVLSIVACFLSVGVLTSLIIALMHDDFRDFIYDEEKSYYVVRTYKEKVKIWKHCFVNSAQLGVHDYVHCCPCVFSGGVLGVLTG